MCTSVRPSAYWVKTKNSQNISKNHRFKTFNCNVINALFLLDRLEVTCDNSHFGCEVVVKLDHLSHHLRECEHNPKRLVSCQQGCGLTVPKDEMGDHNCVREMRLAKLITDIALSTLSYHYTSILYIIHLVV